MVSENLIKDYLMQGELYYSASKHGMITIAEMAGPYAANAAAKMMEDRYHWLTEAGLSVRAPMYTDQRVRQLMTRYPLYAALVARAAEDTPLTAMEGAVRASLRRRA